MPPLSNGSRFASWSWTTQGELAEELQATTRAALQEMVEGLDIQVDASGQIDRGVAVACDDLEERLRNEFESEINRIEDQVGAAAQPVAPPATATAGSESGDGSGGGGGEYGTVGDGRIEAFIKQTTEVCLETQELAAAGQQARLDLEQKLTTALEALSAQVSRKTLSVHPRASTRNTA
eukprot:SAG22_NODE_625_length_8437_cov_5.263133_8_plen_179_part_00